MDAEMLASRLFLVFHYAQIVTCNCLIIIFKVFAIFHNVFFVVYSQMLRLLECFFSFVPFDLACIYMCQKISGFDLITGMFFIFWFACNKLTLFIDSRVLFVIGFSEPQPWSSKASLVSCVLFKTFFVALKLPAEPGLSINKQNLTILKII